MKKSVEMYKEYEGKITNAKKLQEEGKIEEALNLMVEIEKLENGIKLQEKVEKLEVNNFNGNPIRDNSDTKTNDIVAFNKAVLGKPLTEVENALVERVGEDGGYLVPIEQKTQINELKRQLIPLKDYCTVIPVGSLSGSMPLEVEANDKLTNFAEMTEINQSTIKFGQVKWELGDYGDIIPISNTLLQDEKANLTNFVGKRFAKKAVRTENDKILTLVKTATKVTGADYKTINQALNKNLDPAIAQMAIIITNQDGFNYLDNLEDKSGKPLLTTSLVDPTKKEYKGKTIVVLSNEELASPVGKLAFYVGDLASYMAFFDRGAYEMAVSTEAGFTKNATFMRVIERFDIKSVDTKAMVYVELTLAPAQA